MNNYCRVFIAFLNFAFKRNLENRWSVFARVIASTANLLLYLFFIDIIFSLTNTLGDWSKYEVFLLSGLFQSVNAFFYATVRSGIYDMPRLIQTGNLDIILSKPINSQFYISFRSVRPYQFVNMISGLVLAVYSFNKLNLQVSIYNWLLLAGGLVCGVIILYSIYYALATLSIWLIQVSALTNLYHMLTEPLSIPLDIIGKKSSIILTFIIPLALVLTVPSKLLLNKTPYYYIFLCIAFAVVLFFLAVWFWNFSLKHYSSASS